MKRLVMVLLFILLFASPAFAVEVAPRISDKEIIEKLTRLEAGQKAIDNQFDDVNKRFDDINNSINKRFDDVNRRFDTLQWMLGLFITVALSLMAVIGRILWIHQKKLVPLCI